MPEYGVDDVPGREEDSVDEVAHEAVRVRWRRGRLAQEAQHARVTVQPREEEQVENQLTQKRIYRVVRKNGG